MEINAVVFDYYDKNSGMKKYTLRTKPFEGTESAFGVPSSFKLTKYDHETGVETSFAITRGDDEKSIKSDYFSRPQTVVIKEGQENRREVNQIEFEALKELYAVYGSLKESRKIVSIDEASKKYQIERIFISTSEFPRHGWDSESPKLDEESSEVFEKLRIYRNNSTKPVLELKANHKKNGELFFSVKDVADLKQAGFSTEEIIGLKSKGLGQFNKLIGSASELKQNIKLLEELSRDEK